MKILSTLALVSMACLAMSTTGVSAAPKGFKAPKPTKGSGSGSGRGGPGRKFIKTAANFDKGGAKIDLCPSGDCT
ncbi:hypothetical protein ATCC90586_011308 [Pythium insidiosum]|nr:hypothetical protein ATCC90586_011308 [Pythium insidiosum]